MGQMSFAYAMGETSVGEMSVGELSVGGNWRSTVFNASSFERASSKGWPELAKYRQLGKILEVFGKILSV